jgi:hypothetical protein
MRYGRKQLENMNCESKSQLHCISLSVLTDARGSGLAIYEPQSMGSALVGR